jgi:hypothetical protein
MRNEARDLSRQQEEVGQKLDALASGKSESQQRKSLSDSDDRKELLDKLAEQRERMNNLVDRATQISEQAENTEPLLSRQLYDSVRKVSQDEANAVKQARSELLNSGRMTRDLYDRLQKTAESEQGGKVLDLTREMLREGYLPQARQAGQTARGEIDELRRGVERAAESVLGDDAEQLKLAQSELDALTDQLQREIAQAGAGQRGKNGEATQPGRERGDPRQASNESNQGAQSPTGEPGSQPGQGEQNAEQQGRGQGQRESAGQRADERSARSQQMAGNEPQGRGNQPGEQPGEQGQQPGGQQPGGEQGQQGEQPGGKQGQGSRQTAQSGGQQGGQGQQSGRGQQNGNDEQAGAPNRGQVADAREGRNQRGGNQRGGGSNRGGFELDDIFNVGGDRVANNLGGWEGGRVGPITGGDFNQWAERLRDVEDLVETPEMRNALAAARERARMLRRDWRQEQKKPDWAVVELQIVKPLVEVRNRVAEELARRDSKDSLAPIDRDPVPNRFAESVRRYYEELGRDK